MGSAAWRAASSSSVRVGAADHEAELVEGEVLADPDGEREGHDLQVEGALVAGGDLVEAVAVVGDDPGEDVDPAGGALGVGLAPDVGREVEPLRQGDEVGAVGLEDGAVPAQVELVEDVVLDLALDRCRRPAGSCTGSGRRSRPGAGRGWPAGCSPWRCGARRRRCGRRRPPRPATGWGGRPACRGSGRRDGGRRASPDDATAPARRTRWASERRPWTGEPPVRATGNW